MISDSGGDDAVVGRGVRLGVDVGQARVGLAASDPDGLLATPIATLRRDHSVTFPAERGTIGGQGQATQWPEDIAQIVTEVVERRAEVVYVGLPRHLSGAEGQASGAVRKYAHLLAQAVAPATVRLVDERMTTVTAHRVLHAAGRSSRHHRKVVDQVAAVEILQLALDLERSRGQRAGELVAVSEAKGEGR